MYINKIRLEIDRRYRGMAFVILHGVEKEVHTFKIVAAYPNATGIKKATIDGEENSYHILSNGQIVGLVSGIDEITETW